MNCDQEQSACMALLTVTNNVLRTENCFDVVIKLPETLFDISATSNILQSSHDIRSCLAIFWVIGRRTHRRNNLVNERLANRIGEEVGISTTSSYVALVRENPFRDQVVGEHLLVGRQILDQFPRQVLIVGLS